MDKEKVLIEKYRLELKLLKQNVLRLKKKMIEKKSKENIKEYKKELNKFKQKQVQLSSVEKTYFSNHLLVYNNPKNFRVMFENEDNN
jgi:hypothetical protein